MNSQPHTHDLRITLDKDGDVWVRYGDQEEILFRRWHFEDGRLVKSVTEQRIRQSARWMIRRHDRESVAAGITQQRIDTIRAEEQPKAVET